MKELFPIEADNLPIEVKQGTMPIPAEGNDTATFETGFVNTSLVALLLINKILLKLHFLVD